MKRNFQTEHERRTEENLRAQRKAGMALSRPLASMAATESLVREYMEAGDYDAAAKGLLRVDCPAEWKARGSVLGTHDLLLLLGAAFRTRAQIDKTKDLWKRSVAIRKPFFSIALEEYAEAQGRSRLPKTIRRHVESNLSEFRAYLLSAMHEYLAVLQETGDQKETDKLKKEIHSILMGVRIRPAGHPDSRKMNQRLFWQLIDDCRAGVDSWFEFGSCLTSKLEGFSASEILTFERILNQKLTETYRYELLAIATIMMRGCSDDSFEEFRGWLIAIGKRGFEYFRRHPQFASMKVEPGDVVTCEPILHSARIAYMNKTGDDIYDRLRLPPPKLKGKPWKKSDLLRLYPELCKRFGWPPSRKPTSE